MAISNLGRALGASLLGPLRNFLPWEYVILSFAGFAIGMFIFIQLLHPKQHLEDIVQLESEHMEKTEAILQPAISKVVSRILPVERKRESNI